MQTETVRAARRQSTRYSWNVGLVSFDPGFGCVYICGYVYRIRFAQGAVTDLERVRAFERSRVLDEIEGELGDRPDVETSRKKILVGLVPPFDHVPPVWQLRVGDYRVFYDVDVDSAEVVIRAVRRKGRQRTGEVL